MDRRSFILGTAAAFGLAACGRGDRSRQTQGGQGEIPVGLLTPQTGFAANYGPETRQGVDLALAEGGAVAPRVKLLNADEDVLNAAQTLERLKKMVETDGAKVVLGPVFGSDQQAVAPYLTAKGVPWFAFLGAGEQLAGKGSAFIWPGADGKSAGPMGDYAAKDLGYKRLATLAPDYAYGRDLIGGAVEKFKAGGGQVVQQQWVPLGTTDMLQYATSMNRGVDALMMWLVPNDAAAFVREYRNLGIKVPLLLIQGVFDPTFQEIGGQLVGEVGMNEYNALIDNPVNKRFVESYRSKHKGVPNQTTAFAYTAMKAILAALERSNGDTTVPALRSALDGMKLDTVIGPASYNANGIAKSSRTIAKAARSADGTYVWTPLKTYNDVGVE